MVQIDDGDRQRNAAMMRAPAAEEPGWASGLRQVYRAVAEQPVPADFGDLLARCQAQAGRG